VAVKMLGSRDFSSLKVDPHKEGRSPIALVLPLIRGNHESIVAIVRWIRGRNESPPPTAKDR
jgi:hypothetical protein